MSEKFPVNIPKSAERNYEMDSYEARAFPFAHDPVGYLKDFLAAKMDNEHDEQNALFKVIDEFMALVAAVADTDIKTEDKNLESYIFAEDAYDQKKAFVAVLHAVGIKREHLINWAEIEIAGSTGMERLEEKSYGLAIAEIYGK